MLFTNSFRHHGRSLPTMEMESPWTRLLPAAKSVQKSALLCKLFEMFRLVFNFESCAYEVDFFTNHWSGLHGMWEFDEAACMRIMHVLIDLQCFSLFACCFPSGPSRTTFLTRGLAP